MYLVWPTPSFPRNDRSANDSGTSGSRVVSTDFVEIHAVQTAARTRLLSLPREPTGASSWTSANPRSGIRVDRIPARALTVAVIKGNHRPLLDRSLTGHARARVHPTERLYCVIVFRVFRDDFCNVRFLLSRGRSQVWMNLAPNVYFFS